MKDFRASVLLRRLQYKNNWVYNWFSNFEPCKIIHEGITYPSVENFYQAMKTTDLGLRQTFASLTPSQSKRAGRKLVLRPDWEQIKVPIMCLGLALKFTQEPHKSNLLATHPDDLIEWNNWGDRFWGVDISDNRGHNMLGECLKLIRLNLQTNTQTTLF